MPDDAPAPEAEEAEAAEPQADSQLHQLVADLGRELGDDLVSSEVRAGDLWVRVRREAWRRTAEVCRSMGFDYFCFLSGLDWMPATSATRGEVSASATGGDDGDAAAPTEADGGDEVATYPGVTDEATGGGPGAWETGYAGGDTRFQVFARLYSVSRHLGLTLKADLDDEAPAVETWSTVYPGADWHERETWEMFGFDFVGHPHLIHIYLPGAFEGFPLRKDFPLLAREVKPWPGLVDVEPMPEEAQPEEAQPDAADAQPEGAQPVASDAGEAS